MKERLFKRGYKPKPGERVVGFFDPTKTDADKSVRRQHAKLMKQGRVGMGIMHGKDIQFKSWKQRIGIPIGKKVFYFELFEGKPAISGIREYVGEMLDSISTSYQAVAIARAEFQKLPKTEREKAVRRATQELGKLEAKFASTPDSSQWKQLILEKKQEFENEKPSTHMKTACKDDLDSAKSVIELDVVRDIFFENNGLKSEFEGFYQQKKQMLEKAGKIEPE